MAEAYGPPKGTPMSPITGYHAHVYFDAASREQAHALCEAAGRTLGVTVGRMHDKPVGPHPRGSCQLPAISCQRFQPAAESRKLKAESRRQCTILRAHEEVRPRVAEGPQRLAGTVSSGCWRSQ